MGQRPPAPVVKPVVHGALRIEIRKYSDGTGGQVRYGFDWKGGTGDHGRKKVRRLTITGAEEEARSVIGASQGGKLDLLQIPPEQFAEFLQWKARQRPVAQVADVVREFLDEKRTLQRNQELSEKHVRDLAGTVVKFGEQFGKLKLGELAENRRSVEAWLLSGDVGPRRFNNRLTHIVALLRYARAHKYLSPERSAVEDIAKRKVKSKKETYSPSELSALLCAVPNEWLPAVVVGAFCGVRPEEVCPDPKSHKVPLSWEHFLWNKGVIDLREETVKIGGRRFVPINEAAAAWLAPWRKAKGPIVPRKRMTNKSTQWAKAAGIQWKFDALRHSYASYTLAMTQNISQLKDWMGNSEAMIKKHYLERKHLDEALEYFALTPEKVGRADLGRIIVAA